MTKLRIVALTYKTFPANLPSVYQATVDALKHMGMRVLPKGSGPEEGSVGLVASGWRRQVDVDMAAHGVQCTRMRVLAKEGVFFEENTATDLTAHVTRILAERPSKSATHRMADVGSSATILSSRAAAAALPS